MKYSKLVRDNIPRIIESNGQKATFRVLHDAEFLSCLEEKLDEEVAEFHGSKSIEELADIYEVICAFVESKGCTMKEFQRLCKVKRKERGAFSKRIFLIETDEHDEAKKTKLLVAELRMIAPTLASQYCRDALEAAANRLEDFENATDYSKKRK